jgi:hypothetical protein
MRRLLVALVFVLSGAAIATPGPVRAQPVASEYEVKAVFLYQFARFVEWPDQMDGPLHFCIAGVDVFDGALHDTLQGETIDGRPLAARQILAPEPGCHVLFIPDRSSGPIYLRAARQIPVLTVGEAPNFLDEGGIIRLFLDGSNIRFEVNLAAADQAGLRLSARLVQLARNVRPAAGLP